MLHRLISYLPKRKRSPGLASPEYAQAARMVCSGLFDEDHYMAQTSGIAELSCYPQLHYARSGFKTFNPHPDFDAQQYRSAHGLGSDINPLLHHLEAIEGTPFSRQAYEHKLLLRPRRRGFCFEHGRYLYSTLVAFREAGCEILLEVDSDVSQKRGTFPFFNDLLQEGWIKVLSSEEASLSNALCLTDCPKLAAAHQSSILWLTRRPAGDSQSFICPFPMHARQYQQGLHRTLSWLRSCKRTTRVFFSGACTWLYALPYIRLKFGMLGRAELLKYLHSNFAGQIDSAIQKNYSLRKRLQGSPPMVIADQRYQRSPAVLWLEQLAHADFFICLPGNYMPLAHNLTEALAVGTIPILQYGNSFFPPLEPGVNCLAYQDMASFTAAVQRALSMSTDEITSMRANALDYYDRYLDPKAWAGNLLAAPGDKKKLYFPYDYSLKPGWANAIRH